MTKPMIRLFALAAVLLAPAALAQSADVYVVRSGDTLYRISRAHNLTVDQLRELNDIEGTTIEVGQTLRLSRRVPMPAQAAPRAETGGQGIPDRPRLDPPAPPRIETPRVDPPRVDPPRVDPPRVAPPRTEAPRIQAPAATPEPRGPAAGGVVHVVAAGETLFRIALRYDTSVDELRRLNAITGDQIEVGQRLVVGTGGTGPATGTTVRLGPAQPWSITDTAMPADLVHFVEPGETLYSIAATLGLSADDLARTNALSTAPLRPGTMLRLPEPVNPALAARTELPPADEAGLALVYPDVMRGRQTESGEAYDPPRVHAQPPRLPVRDRRPGDEPRQRAEHVRARH